MTTSARTVETNAADALAQLIYQIGDSKNFAYWVQQFEDSFPSPIIRATSFDDMHSRVNDTRPTDGRAGVRVEFEDGSVLHLTVTQIVGVAFDRHPSQGEQPMTRKDMTTQDTRNLIRDIRAGIEMAYSGEDVALIEPLFDAYVRLLDWADLLSKTLAERQEIATPDVIWQIRNALTQP